MWSIRDHKYLEGLSGFIIVQTHSLRTRREISVQRQSCEFVVQMACRQLFNKDFPCNMCAGSTVMLHCNTRHLTQQDIVQWEIKQHIVYILIIFVFTNYFSCSYAHFLPSRQLKLNYISNRKIMRKYTISKLNPTTKNCVPNLALLCARDYAIGPIKQDDTLERTVKSLAVLPQQCCQPLNIKHCHSHVAAMRHASTCHRDHQMYVALDNDASKLLTYFYKLRTFYRFLVPRNCVDICE